MEDVQINRSIEETRGPFTKHFEKMVSDYRQVCIVDLLSDGREKEVKLTKDYYELFVDSELKKDGNLKFLHFDFHRHAKGD